MKHMFSVIVMVLLGLTQVHAQSAAYRYEAGKTYFYEVNSATESKEEMGPKINKYSTSFKAIMALQFEARNAQGTANAMLIIETLEAEIERRDGTQKIGGELAGTSYAFTIDAVGRIVKRDPTLETLDQQRLEIVQRLFDLLPPLGKSVFTQGDSWKNKTVDSAGTHKMPMVVELRNSFEVGGPRTELERRCLPLEYEADVRTTGVMLQYGKTYDYGSRGDAEGVLLYDEADGIVVSFKLEQGSNDSIVESGSAGAIYLEHNTETTYTLKLVR
ncbi:MAG: hypothetical protein HY962_14225 [Ignavibacteriae bacterium]|nr:hypothetical protein [Ignavibacteriota bacterium]